MKDRNREHQDILGSFLEKLPIETIVHLTFPKPVTEVERDMAFDAWIERIQKQHGFTVGFIRGDEAIPYRHLHIALVSHRPLSRLHVELAWLRVVGYGNTASIRMSSYHPGGGGLSYAMKEEGETFCNVHFSANLDQFATWTSGKRQRRTTASERRQGRRIEEQRRKAFAYPTERSLAC